MYLPVYFRKIINRFPWIRNIILFGADFISIAFSVWLSFFLRFEGAIPGQYLPMIGTVIILTLFFCIPIFYFIGLYSFSWSYVGINELLALAKGTAIGFLFLGVTLYFSQNFHAFTGYPRSTLITSFCLIIVFCGFFRLSKRIYKELFEKSTAKEKTLIVGAGDAGEQILRSIINSRLSVYLPVGFVDDSNAKQRVIIHGFKVLGKISDIPEIIKKNQVSQLVIALPSAGDKTIKNAIELARKSGLKKIKITPPLSEIINGEVSLKNLKDVDVGDLLGREPINIDVKEIKDFIENKAVLITGAGGSIGSELSRQIAKFKPSLLLLLDQDETAIFNIFEELKNNFSDLDAEPLIVDIRDEEKINEIFKKYQPKIVFHAAAYKHVPLMEKNSDEAIKNNIFGTKILANSSISFGAEKFVFISTDKAVNPASVMGATKRAGEMICQAFNKKNLTKFVCVRFGNVLDSRGSVIPTFREQIKKNRQVEVTHPEMKRYFMLISEACLLVMQSGAMGRGGEVFVLDMGEPIKIYDLAKEMIKLSGLEPDKDIPIVFTEPRPGEKLFEEIFTAEEGTAATKNKKIFIAKIGEIADDKFLSSIEGLKNNFPTGGNKDFVEALKKIVPFYK
jgi:FlaA1/EpsC-like NDP-sugar epimerase